jgi:hypothetical protein
MMRLVRWGFRPAALIAISVGLLALAALVVFPFDRSEGRPQPLPVAVGEQEIAWLYPATNTTSWERLTTAVQQASKRLASTYPGLDWELDSGSRGETSLTTAPPTVALTWPGGRGKLVFRWYKLTSQWTTRDWVRALMARNPPPLAIVGGNTSYWARELGGCLEEETRDIAEAIRPLLLLTTATADRVNTAESVPHAPRTEENRMVDLTGIYPGRTYRFCFSNRQMATAVTRFVWSRPDLRPEADPAYLVQWTDDSYSQDLFRGYMRVLPHRAADNVMQQWGWVPWVTGAVGLGLPPMPLAWWQTSGFRHEGAVQLDIDSSVGSFNSPNPYEAKVVRDLLAQMRSGPVAGSSLLVVTGQAQPSRRLLRDLARSAPDAPRQFVVVMGDALGFNTIYRDRQVTWPIQDLPFRLVFFSHRNPIDVAAGFHLSRGDGTSGRTSAAGTEDVLLYRDIVEAVALAFQRSGTGCTTAEEMARGLHAVHQVHDDLELPTGERRGVALFAPDGQRGSGTGEHVIYLRPVRQGDRVLPSAVIEVWARQGDRSWLRVEPSLTVSYDEFEVRDVIVTPDK